MKGDFSRLTFDRKKHYSGVLMQQGRVLVDADWNEQQRISRYRMETQTADVVGPSGVPATGGLNILSSSTARSLSVVKAAETNVLKGWIVGAKASILHWDGQALKSQEAPAGIAATLRAVCFADERHGWAVGDQGTILYTGDGGAEWEKQENKARTDLRNVYFMNVDKEYIGCAVGETGTLLYSNNSGRVWKKQDINLKVQLNAVHVLQLPDKKGYKIFAVGNSRTILEFIWDIRQNKLTFTAAKFGSERNEKQDLYSVNSMAIDKTELACAVGEGGAVFFKNGEVWQAQTSGVTVPLKAILAVRDASTPFGEMSFVLAAVGEDGTVCFSADGKAWWIFRTKLSEKVQAVNFIDSNREQCPSIMTLLGDQGGIFNQTAIGWGRFAKVITNLATSAGRIYVDGILCEFEEAAPLSVPPEAGKYLVYVDCWRRHITAVQDPQIRETALGGPDTCTRLQTIAQVKFLPVLSAEVMEKVEELRAAAKAVIKKIIAGLSRRAESDDVAILAATTEAMEEIADLKDEEVAAHLGNKGENVKVFAEAQKEKFSAGMLEKVKDDLEEWVRIQTGIAETLAKSTMETAWEKLTAARPCALAADVKKGNIQETLCSISASGGYTGLENQLYRVEIHKGSDDQGGATFKWSRDNGSVIFPFEVVSVNDNKTIIKLTMQDLGSYYPVSKEEWIGTWVEVIGDDNELAGQPGLLMQIADVPSDTELILVGSLNTALWANKSKHPVIRRWDQRDDAKKSGAVAVVEDQWLDLESGVQVRFKKDGVYRTGDYWMIPARTDAADVEWPRANDEPVALPPVGVCHHYARLAVLTAYETGKNRLIVTELHDCRAIFEPIANHALHVTGINWKNDSLIQFNEAFYVNLLQVGFQIILDDVPDTWTVNPSSLIVTVETANGLSSPVDGIIKVQGNIISWRMKTAAKKAPASPRDMSVMVESSILYNIASSVSTGGTAPTSTVTNYRVRITLKGNLIWRTCCGERIYLDGQVFGLPRHEKDANGDAVMRYGLDFPSGAGNRASDFESWISLYQIETKSRPTKAATASETKDAPRKGKRRGS